MDFADPPSPRAVVRGILGVALALATLVLVVVLVATRRVEWRFVALVLTLWGAWSFFDSIFGSLVEPLGRFLSDTLTGGVMPGGPTATITIEQETAMLERLLETDPPPPPHRGALAGIRLAEIYRTHEHDDAKADQLIARLVARYPNAPELRYVRRG